MLVRNLTHDEKCLVNYTAAYLRLSQGKSSPKTSPEDKDEHQCEDNDAFVALENIPTNQSLTQVLPCRNTSYLKVINMISSHRVGKIEN